MKMSFFLAYLLVCCLPCQPWSFFTNQRPNLLTMMLFFQFPWKAMPTRTNEIATSSPDFRVSKTCQDFLRTINETCFFLLQTESIRRVQVSDSLHSHQSDLELDLILIRFLDQTHCIELSFHLAVHMILHFWIIYYFFIRLTFFLMFSVFSIDVRCFWHTLDQQI